MIRWEYCSTLLSIAALENAPIMDSFGKDGWELVTVYEGIAYMKRPISDKLLKEMNE